MITTTKKEHIWAVLSKRWNLQILKSLEIEAKIRFNELKQSIQGISANVLSDRLDELEKLGLVKKIIANGSSTHIGYVLDERCRNLKKILLDLDEWISLWYANQKVKIDTTDNSNQSAQLLKLLRNQITETEFNYIKDKLQFSFEIDSSDLINNFTKLKNIIFELYGDETGNKILAKLTDQMKSLKMS